MLKNINLYLRWYLSVLFIFSLIFLNEKHNVGNDSTIAEWLINYAGGFTKRGIIGQITIYFSNSFNLNLRDSILTFQILILLIYFFSIYFFLKDVKLNKILILSIFTPIFILYPVAEIEVLARKELFIFCFYLLYLIIKNPTPRFIYKIFILPLLILIWEPVIFFFSFWLAVDIVKLRIKKININFINIIISFFPALILGFYIAFNPLSPDAHLEMTKYLKNNFNENCYTACAMLISVSSISDQFYSVLSSYSAVVFFRYFLIIVIGFGPLIILLKYSYIKKNDLFLFKYFKNLLIPLIIILLPVPLLFAMATDWGRWVNISYFFSFSFYFYLLKENIIKISDEIIKNNFVSLLNNKNYFIIIFIIFSFGWNPKTQITGDVGSKPIYQIPRKAIKILYRNFKNTNVSYYKKIF
jgi:hypothetical protein